MFKPSANPSPSQRHPHHPHPKPRPRNRAAAPLSLTVAALLAATAHATDFTWDGQFNQQWDFSQLNGTTAIAETNWSPETVLFPLLPDGDDNIFFSGTTPNNTVNLNGTRFIRATKVSGGDFALQNGGLLTRDLNVTDQSRLNVLPGASLTPGVGTGLDGFGTIQITNGGQLDLQNGATFETAVDVLVDDATLQFFAQSAQPTNGNTLNLRNQATLNLRYGGATIEGFNVDAVNSTILGDGGLTVRDADVTLAGAAANLTSQNTGFLDRILSFDNNTASVTLRDNARSDFGFDTLFVNGVDAASTSNLSINTGADLTTGTLLVATSGQGTGRVNVDGTGSTLTQTAGKFLRIGSPNGSGESFAAFNARNNATVNTNGDTVVYNNGFLNVNTNATFNANDTLNLQGGNLSVETDGTLNANGSLNLQGRAFLTLETNGTLNANQDISIDDSFFINERGTLNLANGRTLTATNQSRVIMPVANYDLNDDKTFDIQSDSLLGTNGTFQIGRVTPGTLVVAGEGSLFLSSSVSSAELNWATAGGTANVTFRDSARAFIERNSFLDLADSSVFATRADLTVESNAIFNLNSLRLAGNNGTNGTAIVTVQGDGSTISQTSDATLTVGTNNGNSTANLNLRNNGTFNTGTGTGATNINRTGVVNVESNATLNANAPINVDGGNLYVNGGNLNLANNQTLTATNDATVTFTDAYAIDDDTTVRIQNGANFTANDAVRIGGGSDGTLIVDGPNTTFTTNATNNNPSAWGVGDGEAVATFRNGAQGNIGSDSPLNLAENNLLPSLAGVIVESGADLNLNTLNLAANPGAASTALVTVQGFGSSINQSPASRLNLGSTNPDTTAQLSVRDRATVNTGNGTTTINRSGVLNLDDDARFNANGDVDVNGGTIRINDTNGDDPFNLAADRTLLARNNAQLRFIGHAVTNNTTFQLAQGADWSLTEGLQVGRNANGTVIVEDPGTQLTVGGTFVGANLGFGTDTNDHGTLTVRNQANATFDAALQIAADRGTGTLNVQSGANVTVNNDIRIAVFGDSPTGTLNVTGNGSTLIQTGNQSFFVASFPIVASNASANVNITDRGLLRTGNGPMTIEQAGTLTLDDFGVLETGAQLTNRGTIVAGNGSSLTTAEGLNNQGTLTLDTADPGTTPLRINGGFTQLASGTLEITKNGQANELTRLAVESGGAALDGTLAFVADDPLNDFSLLTAYASSQTILSVFNATNTGGTFAQVTGHLLGDGTALAVLYQGNTVRVQRRLLGDANGNQAIEQADLDAVLSNWGTTGQTWVTGDFNGNGTVEQADLDAVLSNWGSAAAPDFTGFTNIPEPAAATVLLSLATLLRRRHA